MELLQRGSRAFVSWWSASGDGIQPVDNVAAARVRLLTRFLACRSVSRQQTHPRGADSAGWLQGRMRTVSQSEREVFRLPFSALLLPVLLFLTSAPLASASVWTVWLFAVPVLALVYIIWTKTVAQPALITVYDHTGRHRLEWEDVSGFEFSGPRWALAVLRNGERRRLPMVRPRDLPRLAEASGGRLRLSDEAIAAMRLAAAATNAETTIVDTRDQTTD